MGKHEVGTPKYIANKIKAKGLQKLRWYCQMCQKQCRDENGFKCHISSESHQRQLLIFADNSNEFIDEFSKEFESGYLELLSRQYGTKRVNANKVYQDYIADRNHLHMNATQWETLTDFVKWLGREGKCVVDETEKGWFVTYIDRDPETIRFQEAMAKKEKFDKDDQEREMNFIQKQIERGKQQSTSSIPEPSELLKKDEDQKLSLKLSVNKHESKIPPVAALASMLKPKYPGIHKQECSKKKSEKRKLSNLESIIEEEKEKERQKRLCSSNEQHKSWLMENIIVKVITKSLGEQFKGKKGFIVKVIDKYAAVVKLLDTNHKLKLDQEHLETVIPNIGKMVKIVNGCYTGSNAVLLSVNIDKYCANVQIKEGRFSGKTIREIPYEDICKLHET